MHGTLYEGDYVVINKLAYGARLPITPLSFNKKFVDWLQLPYVRIFGFSEIKRNDVIAFNYSLTDELPVDMREDYIKRCVALPGDSLKIINAKVYVNSNLDEPAFIYKNYNVQSDKAIDTAVLERFKLIQNTATVDQKKYTILMSSTQADSLYKLPYIKSINLIPLSKDYYHPSVFPNYAELKWNFDFFGPLYIPREGDSILLDKNNIAIYQRIIERFEKGKFSFKNDMVFINDKIHKYYTFTTKLLFCNGR